MKPHAWYYDRTMPPIGCVAIPLCEEGERKREYDPAW